eukprot:scaffold52068_cov61-Phaeocystis_antarctica.AAC.3
MTILYYTLLHPAHSRRAGGARLRHRAVLLPAEAVRPRLEAHRRDHRARRAGAPRAIRRIADRGHRGASRGQTNPSPSPSP